MFKLQIAFLLALFVCVFSVPTVFRGPAPIVKLDYIPCSGLYSDCPAGMYCETFTNCASGDCFKFEKCVQRIH